ncbi:hypothetical protein EJ03DRAFT_353059 [Teratosphaeria nubilosa]|uniref:Uncharacterized protein n=1 Tax=Teratosphaeria nubilosa TaxID=161662 RepID=A0A6G1L3J3_9PEZI|nr:hypothetical protein EJ03DRAFT_353059 [Teratosphaeria nubilosa]
MSQSQHDELAQLFAQSMQLSQAAHYQQAQTQPPQPQPTMEDVPQQNEKVEERMHFISSHYTPTAHIRPDTTSEPSRSPPPPYHEAIMPEAMAETLRQHSIDPCALLPNQVHLFQNADYEQRLRLLELWRIAPPSYTTQENMAGLGKWAPTSVAKEEADAQARYEQMMQARQPRREEHMLDTYVVEPISPIREAGEPAWPPAARMRAASIAAGTHNRGSMDAEPYIVSGYQAEQRVQSMSMDPVYAAGMWQAPTYAQAQNRAMEEQCGMHQQIRNHADWEALNEMLAREKMIGLHGPIDPVADDDMVM